MPQQRSLRVNTEAIGPWSREDYECAAREGWGLFKTSNSENGDWQVQRLDDALDASEAFGFAVPQLDNDESAWALFRAAYERGESHAVKLYGFLREHSPAEFQFMGAESWRRTSNKEL
jgi:hypothetical protein